MTQRQRRLRQRKADITESKQRLYTSKQVDATPDLMTITDLEKDKILLVNLVK